MHKSWSLVLATALTACVAVPPPSGGSRRLGQDLPPVAPPTATASSLRQGVAEAPSAPDRLAEAVAAWRGTATAPAQWLAEGGPILSNNGGNLLSNHGAGQLSLGGGGLISPGTGIPTGGKWYQLAQLIGQGLGSSAPLAGAATAGGASAASATTTEGHSNEEGAGAKELPLAGTLVRAYTASGAVALDREGQALQAVVAEDGSFQFSGVPAQGELFLLQAEASDGKAIAGLLAQPGAQGLNINAQSTLALQWVSSVAMLSGQEGLAGIAPSLLLKAVDRFYEIVSTKLGDGLGNGLYHEEELMTSIVDSDPQLASAIENLSLKAKKISSDEFKKFDQIHFMARSSKGAFVFSGHSRISVSEYQNGRIVGRTDLGLLDLSDAISVRCWAADKLLIVRRSGVVDCILPTGGFRAELPSQSLVDAEWRGEGVFVGCTKSGDVYEFSLDGEKKHIESGLISPERIFPDIDGYWYLNSGHSQVNAMYHKKNLPLKGLGFMSEIYFGMNRDDGNLPVKSIQMVDGGLDCLFLLIGDSVYKLRHPRLWFSAEKVAWSRLFGLSGVAYSAEISGGLARDVKSFVVGGDRWGYLLAEGMLARIQPSIVFGPDPSIGPSSKIAFPDGTPRPHILRK